MFTLRTVFDDKKERNNYLGNDFETFRKTSNDDEFNYYFKELFPNPEKNDLEQVFAIIYNGNKLIPLYKHINYYIVTENGKTFSKISCN